MDEVSETISQLSPLQQAYLAMERMRLKIEKLEKSRHELIAVVAMGCRFPGGANNPDEYWRLLCDGRDAIVDVPAKRWDVDAWYDPDPDVPDKIYVKQGGFLSERVDDFDASFFNVTPRQADFLDPQQRLLLEVAWETLEDAAIAPDRLRESKTGVFIGMITVDYQRLHVDGLQEANPHAGTGMELSFAAGRLSHLLGIQGPSMVLATACSSSLVAVHLACQALRARECDLSLAGGVNLLLDPKGMASMCKLRVLSPECRCKSFDASANGYVRSEGCGMLALERLEDAKRSGRRILAVIRGSAINHDGPSNAIGVPNGPAQTQLLRQALSNAGITPQEVGYLEAHGTGTVIGDPLEINALMEVFGKDRPVDRNLVVGSVKSAIGHLEAAAGVASLIKTILMLRHQMIPPNLHFQDPSPQIAWKELPIEVPTRSMPWKENGNKRIAGVSSFGLSGTNSHVLLEEWQEEKNADTDERERPRHLLMLSAKSDRSLEELCDRYEILLGTSSEPLADICFTANSGRSHFAERVVLEAASISEAREKLQRHQANESVVGLARGSEEVSPPRIAMLFTGQGSQYVAMGRELYRTQPSFARKLDCCAEILNDELPVPLLEVLFAEPETPEAKLLDRTRYTQPALMALEWSLFELWRSWGIEADSFFGHSVGEYAAACAAGVMDLENGLRLIATRARLMDSLPSRGSMAALSARFEDIEPRLSRFGDRLSLAAINGPRQIVVSGTEEGIEELLSELRESNVAGKRLVVSQAFHSSLIDPMLDEFSEHCAKVDWQKPAQTMILSATGQPSGEEVATPEYWVRQARQPVQFLSAMQSMAEQGCDTFLEVGPHPTLVTLGRQCLSEDGRCWHASLQRGKNEWTSLLGSLVELVARGARFDAAGFDSGYSRRVVSLPTYPFQRKRYWIDRNPVGQVQEDSAGTDAKLLHPLLGRQRVLAGSELCVFENRLSANSIAYLHDHQILGRTVYPMAAYLESALAATNLLEVDPVLYDVRIFQPLSLEFPPAVQLNIEPRGTDGTRSWGLWSLSDETQTEHATGHLGGSRGTEPPVVDLERWTQWCEQESSVDDFYRQTEKYGLEYGAAFRPIERLFRSEGQAVAQLRLPESVAGQVDEYHLHPVLWDGALQLIGAALPTPTPYLPVGVHRVELFRPGGLRLWARASLEQIDSDDALASIELCDGTGRAVAVIQEVRLRRLSQQAWRRQISEPSLAYKTIWRELSVDHGEKPSVSAEPGRWLILTDKGGLGERLAARLREEGQSVVVAGVGEETRLLAADRWQLSPSDEEGFVKLRSQAESTEPSIPWRGIVHLWSLDVDVSDELSDLDRSAELLCASGLGLIQTWSGTESQFWFVTARAQAVTPGELVQAEPALLWGLGTVASLEHPDQRVMLVDLETAECSNQSLDSLWNEISFPDQEDKVGWRNGHRWGTRLIRHREPQFLDVPDGPFRVKLSEFGSLDGLYLAPIEKPLPGPGEVTIAVEAAGLNFRDVIRALGMLREVEEQFGILTASDAPFGFECAGRIEAVGEGVSDWQLGDPVLAIAPGSFASHVSVRADFVARRPRKMSFVEAATIPLCYLTAWYALVWKAKLQPGQRVLIHSAAGGVGQAAVRIAQRIGAEIFATASPPKWPFLNAQGIEHVFNSRELGFADTIRKLTEGQGVDVVLNSLGSSFIEESISIVADAGSFIEIGKLGIWTPEQVSEVRPDIRYEAFDYGEDVRENPGLTSELWRELLEEFDQGTLGPLPHELYPISGIRSVFRQMAQGHHRGKLVLSIGSEEASVVRENGTYLITGGLGSLGLRAAQWLAKEGAGALLLVGRRGAESDEQQAAVRLLEASGSTVKVVQADIGDLESLDILAAALFDLPPLRGVLHAAGQLDDGVLLRQSWSRFESVLKPKVRGAWVLDRLTCDVQLDFWVSYSSVASIFGSPGQGSYSSANAYLDALAYRHRSLGRKGLSINWGPWSSGGMATSSQQANRWKQIGLNELDPDEGLQAMEQILRSHSIQVGVLDLDVQKLPPALTSTPFWSELRGKSQRSASISDFLARWQSAPNEEREELLTAHLKQQLSEVLELDPADSLSTQRKFDELGIDSLMAVEFRNRIQAFLSMNLAATIIFDHPSIQQLAEYLNNELEGKETGTKIDTDVLDLSQEVVLDKEIINNLRSVEPAADHLPIFLTGATGFLGTHLLCELLKQTDKDVYCLIRAADRQSARRRLAEALDRYELLEHVAESRIIPVAGDLEERNFGLSDDEFLELSSKVSSVYHNAAMVSFSSPYPTLKKVNVDGTQEALRFATTGTRKRLHYVSSVSVFASLRNFGRFFEEPNVPEVWQDMPLGYAESKWVAELLVLRARELGLPAVIYRPTFISGHSKTGVANVEDITPRVLKWCCQRGTYPEVDLILDSSPVDYVSRAIVDLALQKRSVGKNFHLSNPNPITWMRFIQLIEGLGLSLEKVPFADWLEEIKESQNLDQNPLFGLQDFFRIVSPDDRKGPNAKLGAGHQPRFYCQRTNESFFDESLRCPTFSTELLRIYLEYLLRVGFTEPFEHHLEKEAELKSVKS